MKKFISLFIVSVMVLITLTGCGSGKKTADKTENIRIGGLKGPTSMGLVKLLDDAENGKTENTYEFTMAASADELTPKLVKGELDVLAVPANLGSVLYNKTNGKVKMLAVNMLGAIYIVQKGEKSVESLKDLKGKTIFATGKGTTPEYVLNYLLSQNGLDIKKDVNIEWKSEPTETVASLAVSKNAVAMLPQPFLAVATTKMPELNVVLDLNKEWEKSDNGSSLVTAGLIVRSDFVDENPQTVKTFLDEYEKSAAFVKEDVEKSAKLIEKYGIVESAIAEKALPMCNIVCMKNGEMKQAVSSYYKILFGQNPESVGGKLPKDDYYISYE